MSEDSSKVIKSADGEPRWPEIPRREYKDDPGSHRGVSRYSLLGEAPDEGGLTFQTRYFEVAEGGYTSLERHRHPHAVVIVRGSGTLILGNSVREVDLHDVVYVAPGTLHQFQADRGVKLGFLCTVDRYRDRPELPDRETLEREIPDEEVRARIRRGGEF